jgi:hypothetical protein
MTASFFATSLLQIMLIGQPVRTAPAGDDSRRSGSAGRGRRGGARLGAVPADSGSHYYTAGPIIAVVVVCLLGLLLRWIFGTGRSKQAGARPAPRPAASRPAGRSAGAPAGLPADYGLLRPVALLPGRPEGDALREVLTGAGIRSTVSDRSDGQVEVLVFAADVDRARGLLPPPPGAQP